MNYNQLSEEERYRISALRAEGATMSEIGRRLGRACSTISRELKRNKYPTDGRYRAYHPARMARGRRKMARAGFQLLNGNRSIICSAATGARNRFWRTVDHRKSLDSLARCQEAAPEALWSL